MKNRIAFILIIVIIMGIMNPFGITTYGASFSPRLSLPSDARTTIKEYMVNSSPGWGNYNPYSAFSVGNCTWYAFGRAWEILGYFPGDLVFSGDAEVWFNENKAKYDSGKGGFPYSTDRNAPALGAIAVWENTSNAYGEGGHVAVVEQISDNSNGTKTIVTSESAFSSYYFQTITRSTESAGLGWSGKWRFLGYIYVIGTSTQQTKFTLEDSSNVTSRNATINCWADNSGTMTQIGFYFGSSPEHMNRYVVTEDELGWTRFRLSYSISDYCGLLSPGCTYSYQFFYVNESGEEKSEIAEVTTAGSKVVSFDSYSLSNITETGAIVGAWLDNPYGYQLSSIGIEYGEYRDEMTAVEIVKNVGWTRSHLNYNLHDLGIYLLSGHTFYLKYYADVNGTRYYSDDFIVTTGAIVQYDTFAISNISSTSAQISAWISNPYGYQFSQIGFEYGENKTNYTRVLVTTNVSWTRAHLQYDFASFGVSLKPGTRYYYRFYSIMGDSIYYSTRQSFVTKDSPCAAGHSYTYKVTTTPTTSASGTLTGTCSRCSGTTTVTLPKLNTTDYSYSVTKAATCTAAGTGRYTWKTTTYGSFYFDVTIAKTAHTYKDTVTAPTCTAQGYTTHICSVCGDSYKDTYVNALGHSYTYKVTTTPTTSASGVLTGTCSRCSATTTATLPKLNTTDYSYSVTKAATCTATGTGRYTWKTTAYGSFYFDVTLEKTAHSYKDTLTAPTCTEQGYTTHTCSACGDSYKDSYTDALGHDWDNGVITTQPTETSAGVKTFTCSRCRATKTESVPPLSHTHSYTSVVTAPTCMEKGFTTYTCSCGDSYVTDYTGALGHNWDSGVITTQPSETNEGVKTFTCSRCGATRTETVPATGSFSDCGGNAASCPSAKFTDVAPYGDWSHNGIDFCLDRGLFGGTSATTFEPNTAMNRAMLVTVLWRYEGSPKGYSNDFRDVVNGEWYADAVSWAAANGIVNGVEDGRFDPDGIVTREQMATILYRYSEWRGFDTGKRADFSAFPDAGKVGSWAKTAMQWAVAEGLIGGSKEGGKTYILPADGATRAQVATILMRFIQSIAEK